MDEQQRCCLEDQQLPSMEMPMAVRVCPVRKRVRHAVTPIRVLFTLTVVSLCMVLLIIRCI